MKRILITSSSFLDTPGPHLQRLNALDCEIVAERGPLNEAQLMNLAKSSPGFDGIICGRDKFTAAALNAFSPSTKVISRYGVGLDQIDLEEAERLGIVVTHTPRFNHGSVAELTFGLIIGLLRRIPEHSNSVHAGQWERLTGYELRGKTLAIFGFGMVGREVAKLALCFGVNVLIHNSSWSDSQQEYLTMLESHFRNNQMLWGDQRFIRRCKDDKEALEIADIISLHMDLNRGSVRFINDERLEWCKRGVFLVNVSRGALVDEAALANSIRNGKVAGYAADVVEQHPLSQSSPLYGLESVHITPHIGGRTFDSVVKQGIAAVDNLFNVLS